MCFKILMLDVCACRKQASLTFSNTLNKGVGLFLLGYNFDLKISDPGEQES
jgi:hypothetical protein